LIKSNRGRVCLIGSTSHLATRAPTTEQCFSWQAKRPLQPGGEPHYGVATCGREKKSLKTKIVPFRFSTKRACSACISHRGTHRSSAWLLPAAADCRYATEAYPVCLAYKPPASSVLFSQNKSASATTHQPKEVVFRVLRMRGGPAVRSAERGRGGAGD
jgi:hypothetical protein